jgi:hypothetical protein
MSKEPPRCWPLAAIGVHIDVPPSVQRFIIRTVAAKEVHRPERYLSRKHSCAIVRAWIGNE